MAIGPLVEPINRLHKVEAMLVSPEPDSIVFEFAVHERDKDSMKSPFIKLSEWVPVPAVQRVGSPDIFFLRGASPGLSGWVLNICQRNLRLAWYLHAGGDDWEPLGQVRNFLLPLQAREVHFPEDTILAVCG